jgi:hypothetical protein
MSSKGEYLAKPSGECCLKGSIYEGAGRGRFEAIGGLNTYISTPQNKNANGHVLLYFPDVWGFFPNGFLIMDGFADAGYHVIGPDYFRGVNHSTFLFLDTQFLTEVGPCVETS